MNFQARIEANGQTKILKLGKCAGVAGACEKAARKCPAGWRVTDVHGAHAYIFNTGA